MDERFINTGDGRVPSEIETPEDFTGNIMPLVAGISSLKYYVTDLAGNRSEIIGK